MTDELILEECLHACIDPECLDKFHHLIDELWAAAPEVADVDRVLFESAVLEIAGNIVQHGAGPPPILCNLTVQVYRDRLEAVFLDTADEVVIDLDNIVLPDEFAEHGRGLAMTKLAVDELTYERDGALNRWRLSRHRIG